MADPVLRPLKWSKENHVFAEQHGMFDVLLELFRDLVMWKPTDPLVYIRDELPRIAKSIYCPRVFMLGDHPASEIGKSIAESTEAVYLTLEDIVKTAPANVMNHLLPALYSDDAPNQCLSKLLVATINRRLSMSDCMGKGYVLWGFPKNKTEAMYAQQNGLLPRQVFILLPEGLESFGFNHPRSDSNASESNTKNMTSRLSLNQLQQKKSYFNLKDIGTAYSPDICRVVAYDRWITTKQSDLEAEFLGQVIARKQSGAPWIPKIIVLGPPGSGKSIIVDHVAEKFSLVKIDWMEAIRSSLEWGDHTAVPAGLYLDNLEPLPDDTVRTILDRKLNRDDCQKKGWILEGFPENANEAKIMEDMSLTPNRIFLVSVTEDVSQKRLAARRNSVYSRRIPGVTLNTPCTVETAVSGQRLRVNPHSEAITQKRCEHFNVRLDDLLTFFGNRMVYIDGTQSPNIVKEFAEASVIRPPTLRF